MFEFSGIVIFGIVAPVVTAFPVPGVVVLPVSHVSTSKEVTFSPIVNKLFTVPFSFKNTGASSEYPHVVVFKFVIEIDPESPVILKLPSLLPSPPLPSSLAINPLSISTPLFQELPKNRVSFIFRLFPFKSIVQTNSTSIKHGNQFPRTGKS